MSEAHIGKDLAEEKHDSQPLASFPAALREKIDAIPPLTEAEITRNARPEETVPANEPLVLRHVIDHFRDEYFKTASKHFQKDGDRPFTRDAHPDAQSTYFGILTVPEGLPPEERVGTFATPGKHLVVVRNSTGLFEGAPEWAPNAHAWAMKVFDVNEPNNFKGANVHDIIETNYAPNHYPVFLFPNPAAYEILDNGGPVKYLFPDANPLKWNWDGIGLAVNSLKTKIDGIAETRYGSQLPYAWGDRDVKYLLQPVSSPQAETPSWLPNWASSRLPSSVSDWTPKWHYLTEKIQKQLHEGPITMQLNVQFQQPGEKIEDGTNEWKGDPKKIATIYIPQQEIGPDNAWLGEHLSMNPGRAPVEQKPVGGEGFLRSRLYARQAELRSIFNGVEIDANGMPNGWEERFAGTLAKLKPMLKD